MASFSNLPLELYEQIALACGAHGHNVLATFGSLSRRHYTVARPILHTTINLAQPLYNPESLYQFYCHFAPHHRFEIRRLSIAFGPRYSSFPYGDPDESLNEILCYLVGLTELEIHLETIEAEEDFRLSISALGLLTRLNTLTLRADSRTVSPPRLKRILEYLPELRNLRTLRLVGVNIGMPKWKRGATTVTALEVDSCSFQPNTDLGTLCDLFGTKLRSLRLCGVRYSEPLAPFKAPHLTRLWLGTSTICHTHKSKTKKSSNRIEDRTPVERWLNVMGRAGPIRQLVSEDSILRSHSHLRNFHMLEELCGSASVPEFLGLDASPYSISEQTI